MISLKDKKYFVIKYSGETVCSIRDLWPDLNEPENPQPKDVLKLMKECGDKVKVLSDWNLTEDLIITITKVVKSEEENW